MPITQEQLIDHLGSMTVMEMTALTRELEERWGVSATPMPQIITTTPLETGEEERTEFDVVLESFGDQKIKVIKTVRQMTPGLGLKEAKELVEGVPATIREQVSKEDAEETKRQLEEAGGTITIK